MSRTDCQKITIWEMMHSNPGLKSKYSRKKKAEEKNDKIHFLEGSFKMLFHANNLSISFLSGKGLCVCLMSNMSNVISVLMINCKQKTLQSFLDYSLGLFKVYLGNCRIFLGSTNLLWIRMCYLI